MDKDRNLHRLKISVFIAIQCVGFFFAFNKTLACDTNVETVTVAENKLTRTFEEVKSTSSRIDQLIESQLQSRGQSRNPIATDEVFLRRIYLDVIGRIPTIQEASNFINSSDPLKRERLIDALLNSYGHVSHQFNFFADLFRIKTKHRQILGQPYADFIKDSLAENKPYNQFVRELISSSGPLLQRGNGATGYFLRDLGMPEDNMSNTIRIFMGTRLECAQCHDHPFDRWTQREYYEMLAFMGGMRLKRPGRYDLNKRLAQVAKQNGIEMDRQTRNFVRRTLQPLTYSVDGSGTGLTRLPEGFLGDDGEEGDIVQAMTIFDDRTLVKPKLKETSGTQIRKKKSKKQTGIKGALEVESRAAFADWLTDTENPRFATVIANRLWKRAMGLGLIEPVDVLEDQTVASNPELMEFLTKFMVDVDFDMREFVRAIYYSASYQAESYSKDVGDPQEFMFNGPVLRRLTAEQLWDSLLTLTVAETDVRRRVTAPKDLQYFGRDVYESFEKIQELTDDEILEIAKILAEKGSRGLRTLKNQFQMDEIEYRKSLNRQINDVRKKLKQAKRNRNTNNIRRLTALRTELIGELNTSRTDSGLRRASELQSPAPTGHLLRDFGQSDRETIENANLEPSLTQVLSMMNGYIDKKLIRNPNTVLLKNAVWQTNHSDKIKAIYLTILTRLPTNEETYVWLAEYKNSKSVVSHDLIWTLVNSNEFLFNK